MQRNISVLLVGILSLLITLGGCANSLHTKSPNHITLNLWHNYVGQLKETMDDMIDEFNETVGEKEGIIINVTSISERDTIHEKLVMAANGDPGAPSLPDMASLYPKTALMLVENDILLDLKELFTPAELDHYIPAFIEEGQLDTDSLYVFPVAKSTEVLFLNSTIFDRFARDSGAKIEDLQTMEGISQTAALYYEWTDNLTPDIPDDGKMFFMHDTLFNFSLVGYEQLDLELIENNTINVSSPAFEKIWAHYYKPAVLGHMAVFNGYSADLAKTGDIICSTASTAGISFLSPTVTYPDNTREAVEFMVLPYPRFAGANKVAIQRGAGMGVIKSTPEREKAASIFIKWFTRPDNNFRFVSSTGYIPVTKEAFGEIMSEEVKNSPEEKVKNFFNTIQIMQNEYDFCVSPLFEDVAGLQAEYENYYKDLAKQSRQSYINLIKSYDSDTAYEKISIPAQKEFINKYL